MQDRQTTGCKACDEAAEQLDLIPVMHARASEVAEVGNELGEGNIPVVGLGLIIRPLLVDGDQLVEAAGCLFFLFALGVEGLELFACQLGDLVRVQTDLRDLHREDLILLKVQTHDFFVQRVDLVDKIIGILSFLLELRELRNALHDEEDDQTDYRGEQQHRDDRDDPRYALAKLALAGKVLNDIIIRFKVECLQDIDNTFKDRSEELL